MKIHITRELCVIKTIDTKYLSPPKISKDLNKLALESFFEDLCNSLNILCSEYFFLPQGN